LNPPGVFGFGLGVLVVCEPFSIPIAVVGEWIKALPVIALDRFEVGVGNLDQLIA
jgi:hypothetical protein